MLLLEKKEKHSGVEIAASGAHDQPARRGKPHCRIDTSALFDGSHTRSMSKMRKNKPSPCNLCTDCPLKFTHQILIRKPMKTITLNAMTTNLFRQRIETCNIRHGTVKCRIKTCNLSAARKKPGRVVKSLQCLRKVLRSKNDKSMERIDQCR